MSLASKEWCKDLLTKVLKKFKEQEITPIKNSIGSSGNGSLNKYSEDEMIIGEWIDGKPVYRKMFIYTKENIDISDLNIDTLIKFTGVTNTHDNLYLPFSYYDGSKYYLNFLIENNYLKYLSATFNLKQAVIFMEYTKTTD